MTREDELLSWMYKIGSSLCHLISERCLHVNGEQMLLCIRCSSWYLSTVIMIFILSVILLFFRKGFYVSKLGIIGLLITLFLMILDGLSQSWGLRSSNNTIRLVTGSLFGSSGVLLLWSIYWYCKKGTKALVGSEFIWFIFSGTIITILLLKVVTPINVYVMRSVTLVAFMGYLLTVIVWVLFALVGCFKDIER